jgi:signal transduction histidine kinase
VAARLDDDRWTAFHAEARTQVAAAPGRTVALVRRSGSAFTVVASEGGALVAATELDGEPLRAAAAAVASPRPVSAPIYERGGRRYLTVALGPPVAPPDSAVLLESPLAPPGQTAVAQQRPYQEIHAALYAGGEAVPDQLILSTTDRLPLSGHVVRRTIDVGGSEPWLLVVREREPLGGTLAERVPWLILAMGLLSALVATAVTAILLRRRDYALALVDARTAELQATVERLSEVSRTKSTFLAAVSHELRTPLAAVIGFAELLRMRADELPPERQRQMLDRIVEQGGHLRLLIDDLVDATRIEFGTLQVELEPVQVPAIALRTVEALGANANRVALRMEHDLAPALGNEARLEQVLTNLVGNALRHSHPGGPIELCVAADAGDVMLVIADTGPGIDPALLPNLFEPFIQGGEAAAREGGLGLGLYIVRGLVDAMGGTIRVDSGPGGTRFAVRLRRADAMRPRAVAPAEDVAAAAAPS